ncbi:MAG: S-layer homology domain-containing protein [bacterium]|nr:S-layer homology domain-containing protein [bacterium]
MKKKTTKAHSGPRTNHSRNRVLLALVVLVLAAASLVFFKGGDRYTGFIKGVDPNPSYGRCLEVKKIWDGGSWTQYYGSTDEPSVCKNLYSYDDWENPSYYYCVDTKVLWEEGDWTAKYGSSLIVTKCQNLYYNYSTWYTKYPKYYECSWLKQLWDEGGFTYRFGWPSYPSMGTCKEVYYTVPYNWNDNPGEYDGDYTPWRCALVKEMWDEGGFTDRFSGYGIGNDASLCKSYYYTNPYTWLDSPPQYYDGPYQPWTCSKIKTLWDEGGYTERFGSTGLESGCAHRYYEYPYTWGGSYNSTYYGKYTKEKCDEVKELWDEGGYTDRFAGTDRSNDPYECSYYFDTYPHNLYYGGFGDGGYGSTYTGKYTQNYCWDVKDLWEEGGWTERYGSTSAPSYCKFLFFDVPYNWVDYPGDYEEPEDPEPPKPEPPKPEPPKPEPPKPEPAKCAGFSDIDTNSKYCDAIKWAKENDIVSGYADGEFKPYKQINRVEILKVVLESTGYKIYKYNPPFDGDLGFSDVYTGQWYMPYIKTAKQHGIFTGDSDSDTARPNESVNRVESLKMLFKAIEFIDDYKIPLCRTLPFYDVTYNDWYYDFACASYLYSLYDLANPYAFEPGTVASRGDVVLMLYRLDKQL